MAKERVAVAEPGAAAKLREDLAKVEAAIAAQQALRGVLDEEVIAAGLRPLEAQRDALREQLAGAEPVPAGEGGSATVAERSGQRDGSGRRRRPKAGSRRRAKVEGSGSIAQGDRSTSAGDGGLAVGHGGTFAHIEKVFFSGDHRGETGEALESAYLEWLFERLRGLSLAAIDPAVAAGKAADARLELDAVYTGLMTLGSQEPGERAATAGERGAKGGEVAAAPGGRPVSALARLDRERRLVLLGDPGSGKSTFVSFVALCLAGQRLGRRDANLELLRAPLPDESGDFLRAFAGEVDEKPKPQPWRHGPLLPVRVVLRDFAFRGLPPAGERATAADLWSFVRAELEAATLGGYADALERHLRNEGGLVLFDGLDEVPEAETRRVQIRQAVEDFARAFSRCRILVTSRTYAYRRQEWHLAGFAEAVLASFGPAQVARFVERWYAHLAAIGRYGADDARGRATLLREKIGASDRLSALAERPLLLTLMASLHAWHGAELPERRERLYAAAVDLLLDSWERRRQLELDPHGQPVRTLPSLVEWLQLKDKESLRVLLEKLAFDAHSAQPDLEGTADIPEDALVGGLMRLGSPGANLNLLVEHLRDRAGLLEPRGVGVYTFPHRTFQEYLAACHLTRGEYPEEVADLARRDPERWREVALLAGAKAASGPISAVWDLADRLCERDLGDPAATTEDLWGAHLAAQALIEVLGPAGLESPRAGKRRIVDRIRGWLAELIRCTELPALERALAGDNLSRLGDPRLEVTTVDGMELCWVPPGRFWMGDEARDDEEPGGAIEIQHGYWIGRFPVTAAQFSEFEAAGGYIESRFWKEAEAAGWWAPEGIRGRGDHEPRRGTGLGDSAWSLAGRPVVAITWYEALAFCRWLTDRWHEDGRLPPDWTVSPPSEAEWEKAARGGIELPRPSAPRRSAEGFADGAVAEAPNEVPRRSYPWGDDFDPDRSNAGSVGIGATSAVGCFPGGRSPYGVEELSGNCWEWTRSHSGDYPYPASGPERAQRERLDSDAPRVLRGGSYFYPSWWVRCASRDHVHPGVRGGDFGFRVVVLPPFSSDL